MKKILLIAVILIAFSATTGFADNLDDALDAYDRNDYETALTILNSLADQDNGVAQYYLGLMYDQGKGVSLDYAEAARWFRKAADLNIAKAQYYLGTMYAQGRGVPQDYAESLKWFRNGAAQGEEGSQFSLGLMYANGIGVPQDLNEAYMWMQLVIEGTGVSGLRDIATKTRDELAKNLTPAEIREAQKKAREWKPTGRP